MKKLKLVFSAICAISCVCLFGACAMPTGNVLGSPSDATEVTFEEKSSPAFVKFKDGVEKFAADFAETSYAGTDVDTNFAVSPVSVYMALGLAAECAGGETRSEILSALNVGYEELNSNFSVLYRTLSYERKAGKKTAGVLLPTNSIWINDGTPVNKSCIEALSQDYFCHSRSADFKNDNEEANKAIRNFVKQQTNNLIDKNFELSDKTLFTIINTLYLKTLWNAEGDELKLTDANYDFANSDGSVKSTKFMSGYYKYGRAVKTEEYSTFYTSTYDGYKIKFIVPADGYGIENVFTAENISKVNSLKDYGGYDEETEKTYNTRCIFPSFKSSFDEDLIEILSEKFGIKKLFTNPGIYADGCDFSALSEEQCYCVNLRHVTDLTVDRRGIEGAAVTVIGMDGATSGEPPVLEDFVVDRAFGYIITDSNDITLFSGVINTI